MKQAERYPITSGRIRWLDVMKCLGIFAIYLGHLGPSVGYSYDFVFSHHVALFFFASGCAEALSTENRNAAVYLKKRVRTILIPYFVFGIISIAVYELSCNAAPQWIRLQFLYLMEGSVRNTFCAGGLWFFTCLFAVQVMFVIFHKFCPKWMLLAVSLGMCCISQILADPLNSPQYPYNIDSACYFFFYYVLGYLLFPLMRKILGNLHRYRIQTAAATIFCIAYALLLFFQNGTLLKLFYRPGIEILAFPVQPLPIIWLYILGSWMLQDIRLFNHIGQDTLYLCCSEYFVSTGVSSVLGLLGLSIDITVPLAAYLYSALLVYLADRFFVPAEKRILCKVEQYTKAIF